MFVVCSDTAGADRRRRKKISVHLNRIICEGVKEEGDEGGLEPRADMRDYLPDEGQLDTEIQGQDPAGEATPPVEDKLADGQPEDSNKEPCQTDGQNEVGRPRMYFPFAQKLFADEGSVLRNTGTWDILPGSICARADGQVAIKLPNVSPVPIRAHLRVISCGGNKYHRSSAPGAQDQFSCVGRLFFYAEKWAGEHYNAAVYFRTAAWSGGLPPRCNSGPDSIKTVMGDPIEAILKSDNNPVLISAMVRNWWPISRQEWQAMSPGEYREPGDISRDARKLFSLSRISHADLRPDSYEFEKAQAIVAFPAVSENTARTSLKGRNKKGKSDKSPPPEESGGNKRPEIPDYQEGAAAASGYKYEWRRTYDSWGRRWWDYTDRWAPRHSAKRWSGCYPDKGGKF